MTQTRRQLIDQLLEARAGVLNAEQDRLRARERYKEAEKAYMAEVPIPGNPPENVVVGMTAVMVKDDWYDLREGERLEFHTMEVIA